MTRSAISHQLSWAIAVSVSTLILIACTTGATPASAPPSSLSSNPEPVSDPTFAQQDGVEITTFEHGNLGTMLVDGDGRTLYLHVKDDRNASGCTDACAEAWPPLLTEADPVSGDRLDPTRLGTIPRGDGALQVSYNGRALYYFAGDGDAAGDAKGQGMGGIWFAVSPNGSAIQTNAAVNAVEISGLGTMLADAAGRSLYQSARDQRGVSNCTGVCARVWPPLLTVDDPVAGDGVPGEALGTITRNDGSRQVTYDGRPLHQFSRDNRPGDANGHALGDAWFVVNPEMPLMIGLAEQNDSGQSGWATVTPVGDRTLVVLNRSTGDMAPEAVHIREGPCGNSTLGRVVYALNFFVEGSGSSVSVVPAPLEHLQSGHFAINSHVNDYTRRRSLFPIYSDAENLEGGKAVSTSCGNIPAGPDSISFTLRERNRSGQSGRATLTARGGQTEVVLISSIGTEQAAGYVHRGPCDEEAPGRAAHLLNPLAGGASITTVDAPLTELRTGDFAISTHANGSGGKSVDLVYSDEMSYAAEAAFSTSCGVIPGDDLAGSAALK